jgi:HEAT repeat protein
LAQIGTAADEALSRALTEQKGDERRHIVYELRMTNHPSLLAPLRRIAEDRSEDGSTRVHAVKAVAKTGGVGADACVRALLSDSEPHVRIAACDALCAKGMPGASEALGTLIYDPDPEARAWARHRAGAPPRGAPVIKPAIPLDVLARELKSPDEAVRTEVVEALGRRSDGTGIPFLLEVFDGSHSSDLRRDALNAIGRMDSPESRAVVRRAFDDPDPWVRKTAAGHLAARRTTEAAELIAARIPHEEPWLQFEMAKSMAHIGSNAVPPLLTLLQNTNDKVRSTAAEALGWIGDPRAVDALIPLLDDGEGRVGGMAQGALSQLGGTKAERAINRRVRRWQRAAFMATSAGGHMAALTAVAAVLWSWRRTFREFGLVMTLGRGAMTMAFSLIVAFLLFAVGSQFVPSLAVDAWRTSAWSSALRLGLFESVFGPLSFWLVYSSASALGRAQTSFDRVVCSGSAERSIRAAKRFAAATAVCLAVASPTWFHVHRAQCLPFTVFGIAMTAVGVWMFRRVRELAGWLALGDSTTGAATDTPFLYRRLFSAGGIVLMTLGLPLYFLGVSLVLMDVPYWHSSSGGWGTAFGVPFLVPGLLLILSGWLVWRRGRWETGCQQREESIP